MPSHPPISLSKKGENPKKSNARNNPQPHQLPPPTNLHKNNTLSHTLPTMCTTLPPPSLIVNHHPLFPKSPTSKMPLQHVVTFQAFQEITNFIRNNGGDWDEFCTITARSTRKAKKTPVVSNMVPSKHKTAENEGRLAIEPLLKENPHRFVLFSIQNANIWQMYKKRKRLSGQRRK
jgi:hypothetical protein